MDETQLIDTENMPSDIEQSLLDMLADEALALQESGGSRVPLGRDVQQVVGGDAAMAFTTSPSGEIVTLYDTYTGEPSQVLKGQLKAHFRKFFPKGHVRAGQRVFSWNQPSVPERGKFLCPLNPKHPDYTAITTRFGVGFVECPRDNAPSEYHIQQHLQIKHPKTWKLMQQAKAEDERSEANALQREMISALSQKPAPAPVQKGK